MVSGQDKLPLLLLTKLFKYACAIFLFIFVNMNQSLSNELQGKFTGEYSITIRAAPTGAILGHGVTTAKWVWDFDKQEAILEGNTLSVGFNYAIHDLDDANSEIDITHFERNEDNSYTLHYALQIYHPGLGYPISNAQTTFSIKNDNNKLTFITLDVEQDAPDGIAGSQITDVFPLTIEPEFSGYATALGLDSNNDGISDSDALSIGLNPLLSDTDFDGISDVDEVGSDILSPIDSDQDSIIDALEFSDAAYDAQKIMYLPVINGEKISLNIDGNWQFTHVENRNMMLTVPPTQNIEDILTKDSTLGEPGINYPYGSFQIELEAINTAQIENSIQLIITSDKPLPEKLLIYAKDILSGRYVLIDKANWKRMDDHSIQLLLKNSHFDFAITETDSDSNNGDYKFKINLALGENSLGDVHRNDQTGSLYFLILLFMFPLSIRRLH